ncbi:PEPxxWA-CTERM sorting domain-containing protein [uncultured Sphingomonas sp.]|uniref:PEPxxWA-CTERM sorting domain-containing protein n=1 Tax=uncultured Sphingomonas sp. TaxID=158754 RepID=UPI0025EA0637|nr:PEPxxWA-CTERM sorting domain-containing protein [uncultured Sphingomonas sp.]
MRHLAFAVILALAPASAHAVTIDFETLGFDGETNPGPKGIASPLVIGDYTFTATDPFGLPPILVYPRQSTNNPDFGGTSIVPNRSDPGITITRTDGGVFAFNAVDLTFAYDDQNASFPGGLATFTLDGDAFSLTRAFDNAPGFQTFGINAFVSSVRISADSAFAIDNVVLDEATAAIPEPAAWAMMLAGFGAIGAAMRRRQTAAPDFA